MGAAATLSEKFYREEPELKKVLPLFLLAGLYLGAPIISGMLRYRDPRGPVVYPAGYHRLAHRVGSALIGRGKMRIPFSTRPLFYGLEGKPIARPATKAMP